MGIPVKRLDVVDVCGNSRQMGRSHGEQRRDQIASDLQQLDELAARWGARRQSVLECFGVFKPMFEHVAPALIDEMLGVAEGAGRSFDEILFLNARHGGIEALEAGRTPTAACTSFAVGGDGAAATGMWAGQTKDTPRASLNRYYLLRTKPTAGSRVLVLNYPGEVGQIGIGSHGVAVFSNGLFPRRRWLGGPHNLARRAMLESASVDEAGSVLSRLDRWCEANYLVADSTGRSACFEILGGRVRRVDPIEHIITHANHAVSADLLGEEDFADRQAQSTARAVRLDHLLRQQHGNLTWQLCARTLSDHEHEPQSICRHGAVVQKLEKLFTTCALIADIANRSLHVCLGNPCQVPFEAYGFD